MRVVIVDSDLPAGRGAAAVVEGVLATADVLLYDEVDAALTGIRDHAPDVVVVAPTIGDVDGPSFVRRAREVSPAPKYVGVVAAPDAAWSTRYVDAGAHLVVAAPVDAFDVQMALRHRAGGVPG
jgi:DNA-binding NarL/FixJ family response regulator